MITALRVNGDFVAAAWQMYTCARMGWGWAACDTQRLENACHDSML